MSINNTLSSSIYGAINAPTSLSPYKSINPGLVSTPMSLTSQVKAKTPTIAPAPIKPVSLTGGASNSSLLNNPLKLSSIAPNLSAQSKNQPLIPVAQAETISHPQPNAGNAFSSTNTLANLLAKSDQSSTSSLPTYSSQNTGNNQDQIAGLISTAQGIQNQLNNLQNQQSQQNSQPIRGLFPDVISSLMANAQKSQREVQLANQNLEDYTNQVAKKNSDIIGTGADLNFKTGQQQALQTQAAIGQQARQTAVQNALSGQGNVLQALESAAGLTQPQITSFGQTSFNPLTAQFMGGGSLPENIMQQYADMAANGQYSAIPSSITSNPVLSAQLNDAAKRINPNFSPLNSASLGSTNADIISKATADVSNMQTNLSAADTNLAQLTQLATENGINDLSSVTANKISNLFKGEFSNKALYSFNALLAGTRGLYTAVLESRANLSPTDAYNIATQQVPDNINLSALKDLTGTLKSEAQNIIGAKQQQIQGAQNGSTTNNTQNNQGGNDSINIGNTNFRKVGGQWIAS